MKKYASIIILFFLLFIIGMIKSPLFVCFSIFFICICLLTFYSIKKCPIKSLLAIVVIIFLSVLFYHSEFYFERKSIPQFSKVKIFSSPYSECVLVKDVPNDNKILKDMMISYRDSVGTPLDNITDSSIWFYSMSFYRYSRTTSLSLKVKDYADAYIEEYFTNNEEDEIGYIYNVRCKSDSTKWNTYIRLNYKKNNGEYDSKKDTITYYGEDLRQ